MFSSSLQHPTGCAFSVLRASRVMATHFNSSSAASCPVSLQCSACSTTQEVMGPHYEALSKPPYCLKVKGTLYERYEICLILLGQRWVREREREGESFPFLRSYKETTSPFLSCWEVYGQTGSCNWWLTGRALRQQDYKSAERHGTHTHTHTRSAVFVGPSTNEK